MTAPVAEATFEQHRPLLLGLAYRLLGSMWDAEDVVQEAWLRWSADDRSEVREPRAYLVTVVSRLALDQLGSARVRREAYVGPWLPEPVPSDALGPMDTVELRESVSFATLHLLEVLTPPERAVFVLREAFALPYDEIATILQVTPATARQLQHRAATRLADGTGRFTAEPARHEQLLTAFLTAAGGGDWHLLTDLLAEDVVLWADGGGRVRAALQPIGGRAAVVRFLAGLAEKYPVTGVRPLSVNGQPAVELVAGGERQLLLFGVTDEQVARLYIVRNPDKLSRV